MLIPRHGASLHEQRLNCYATLMEAKSLVEMAVTQLDDAQREAPPLLRGTMADVVARLRSDTALLKAAADAVDELAH